MKKIKIILSVVSIFLFVLFISDVKAEIYEGYIYEGEKIDGIYFYKHREDTEEESYEFHNFHKQAAIYRRSTDNQFVYCIESWETLIGTTNGDHLVSNTPNNLTKEQINKITRLAYYGYGYKDANYDHTDSKWYAITQYMIWQIQAPHIGHYLVDSISSTTATNRFNDEIEEMNSLIQDEVQPYFKNLKAIMFLGDEITLIDTKKSLGQYEITAEENTIVEKIDNSSLRVKYLSPGYIRLALSKKYTYYNNDPIYYTSDKYQDVMVPGNINQKNIYYSIQVNSGTFETTINRYDYQKQDYVPYKNIKVSLYKKETNEIIDTQITNARGKVKFIDLERGTYYYTVEYDKDIYIKDNNSKEFLIDEKNPNISENLQLDVQNIKINIQVIKELFKIKNNNIEYYNDNFEGIKYGLFDESDKLIDEAVTDSQGEITFYKKIPYGKYYIKELNMEEEYEKDENKHFIDFYKENNESTKSFSFEFIKKLKKGKVILKKIDEDSLSPLNLVSFKIFDINDILIYQGVTDKNGTINLELPYGKYYLKETKTLDNYILNNETININIDKEELELIVTNKKIENSIKFPNSTYSPTIVTVPSTDKYSYIEIINLSIIALAIILIKYV